QERARNVRDGQRAGEDRCDRWGRVGRGAASSAATTASAASASTASAGQCDGDRGPGRVATGGIDGVDADDVRTDAAAEAGRRGAGDRGETDLDAVREELVVVDGAAAGRLPGDHG